MARITPAAQVYRADAGYYRELDVLERLERSLPDDYEVFHSVSFHTIHQGLDRHGEIDLVVLAPSGNMLLVEVKAGQLELIDGQLIKLYGDKKRDVARQTRVQHASMLGRLADAGLYAHVTNCLVLPDFRVEAAPIVSMPRERIIDATEFDELGTRLRAFLAPGVSHSDVEAIRHFLGNVFKVSLDLNVLGEQLRTTSTRLADGLATWVPRIGAPSGVLSVQATAGSGKTQLALRLLQAAAVRGSKALYVCFNRSLADYMSQIAPPAAKVSSFHELCVAHWRQAVGALDFSRGEMYQALTQRYGADAPEFAPAYELIVIDEGQDFAPEWVAALLPQLTDTGQLYFLEDNSQRLYEHPPFELEAAVSVQCDDNFRSPRAIVDVINALRLADRAIEARSPFAGEIPGYRIYEDNDRLEQTTVEAVQSLLARGIALADIVVLTAKGRESSALLRRSALGPFSTRRFAGQYSADGEALWHAGDLLVETIHRFKGQSAAGVVLTELDVANLHDRVRRRLFVGMTRARIALEMVMTPRTELALVERLTQ